MYPRDAFGNPSLHPPNVSFPNGTATVALKTMSEGFEVTYIASVYGLLPVDINFTVPGERQENVPEVG